jgi:hypothetical protein
MPLMYSGPLLMGGVLQHMQVPEPVEIGTVVGVNLSGGFVPCTGYLLR